MDSFSEPQNARPAYASRPEPARLRDFALFEAMDADQLAFIAGRMSELMVLGGETLLREGDDSDAIYFLLSGRCRALRAGTAFAAIHAGEPIGEIGYFARSPRTATIVAERDCWLAKLGYADLEALIERFPAFSLQMARVMAIRLSDSRQQRARAGNRTIGFIFGPEIAPDLRERCQARLKAVLARHGACVFVTRDDLMRRFGAIDHREVDVWLSQLEQANEKLVFLADFAEPLDWIDKCRRQSDQLFLVHDHAADASVGGAERLVLENRRGHPIGLVLTPEKRLTTARGAQRWSGRAASPLLHVGVDDAADWSRVARYCFDRAVGLVLCGGGALYALHIGAIKAMVEHGIVLDHVGGSSAGACAGLAYCGGISIEDFAERFRRIVQDHRSMSRFTVPVYGLIDPRTYERRLSEACEGRMIEDLQVPFFATAMNLSRSRFDVIDRGPVWEALRATTSIPALLPPFTRDGDLLADGAMFDALPVRAMRERLSGPIISINFGDDRAPTPYDSSRRDHWLARLGPRSWRRRGGRAFPTMIDSMTRSFMFAGKSRVSASMKASDIVLSPDIPPGAAMLDWSKHHEMIESGYAYTRDRLLQMEREGHEGLARVRATLV